MLVFIRPFPDTGSEEWTKDQIIALVRSALYLVSFAIILLFALIDLVNEPARGNAVYILVAGVVAYVLHCTEREEN